MLLGQAFLKLPPHSVAVAGSTRQSIIETQSAGGLQTNKADSAPRELVVQNASGAPHIAPVIAAPTPVPVQATIIRDEQEYSPKFHGGHSERIAVKLGQTIPIRLSWPNDNEHEGVFVQAVHGGKIDGGSNDKSLPFGPDKTVSFTFTPDSGTGSYEIVLRRGTTEEALSFWVPTGNPGSDPPTH